MFRSKLWFQIVVVCVVFLLFACGSDESAFECTDPLGCVTVAPEEPIEIALLQVLSGDVAPLGTLYVDSTELAIADRGDLLKGHSVKLHTEDTLCAQEGGSTAAQKVTANAQLIAILGTTCSGAAIPASEIMSEAGLVMISGGNTAPSLTAVNGQKGADWRPGYFRTAPSDTVQGRAAATFAFEGLGITKAATINDGDAYTEGLTGVFNQVFSELGGEVVFDATISKGDTDMNPVLEGVLAAEAELVFFPIFPPEGNLIIKQARENPEFESIAFMSADGLFLTSVIDDLGDAGIGLYFVGPSAPDSEAFLTFDNAYRETYGEPANSPFHGLGYDAANLLFDAIEAVAVADENVDGMLHIGRQALRDHLYATTGYSGVTGSLNCDEFGDCGAMPFKIMQLTDPAGGISAISENIVFTYTPN